MLVVLLITACNSQDANRNSVSNQNANSNSQAQFPPLPGLKPAGPVDPNFSACNTYFPLVPGSSTKYRLSFSTGIVADITTVFSSEEENGRKVFVASQQTIDTKGGSEKSEANTRKYICDGEKVKLIFERNDNRVAGHRTESEVKYDDKSFVMLEPTALSSGKKWSYDFYVIFNTGDGTRTSTDPVTKHLEVLGIEDVKVAAGTFTALKIEIKAGGAELVEYYARGIGLIKRTVIKDGTTTELQEYSGLKPLR